MVDTVVRSQPDRSEPTAVARASNASTTSLRSVPRAVSVSPSDSLLDRLEMSDESAFKADSGASTSEPESALAAVFTSAKADSTSLRDDSIADCPPVRVSRLSIVSSDDDSPCIASQVDGAVVVVAASSLDEQPAATATASTRMRSRRAGNMARRLHRHPGGSGVGGRTMGGVTGRGRAWPCARCRRGRGRFVRRGRRCP